MVKSSRPSQQCCCYGRSAATANYSCALATLALHTDLHCPTSHSCVTPLPQGGYSLTLTLPESDRYYADKLDILERNGLSASATFNIVRGQDPSDEMMGFLRLMQLQGE